MVTANRIAEMAAAMGEPARAAMLAALMDGRAMTATELARVAGIAPPTASGHLARLVAARLVAAERHGRHRYHRLAGAEAARLIESMMQMAGAAPAPHAVPRFGPRDAALRQARTCYDHLAGRLGVGLADALVAGGWVAMEGEAAWMTEAGQARFGALGIPLPQAARHGRPGCRPCLDWSERRPHLAGRLGAALCSHAFGQGWVHRVEGTRAVTVTPKGRLALREAFGLAESG